MGFEVGLTPALLPGGAALAAGGEKGDNPARIKEAASQFEAVLIGQMLKSSREGGSSGWMGSGDDQAGCSMMEMAEGQIAQAMASQGGLGLAAIAVRGILQKTAQ